ncbi:MAG: hypothetical protein AAF630_01935 [Cyanobacteria bacterium P01_C01_bin.38]
MHFERRIYVDEDIPPLLILNNERRSDYRSVWLIKRTRLLRQQTDEVVQKAIL